ncbi:MAG: HEAT repeat domain-containing protein [Oscillatoria sp. PMC 1068.18]|nr:HEAT repeat domain-containing protein [Oscillatoria sp. PMC 1076.18]MEC4990537.1 HEAT repeat domain-containing protein [Oscillatoria sp. PMC 1068.18]
MNVTPESVQQLLNSDDFGSRLSGINQLRQLDRGIAFEMVQPLMLDKNARVRYSAASQMDSLGEENLEKSLEILRDRLLNDSEPDVQAAAADAIGALKLTEAFDDLNQLYHQSPEWLVKFSIVAALGEMGDPRGFDLLQEALESDNNLIQTSAIGSLGELGDPRAIPLLVPLVANTDWQVRYRLVQALGRLGGQEAKLVIEKLAKDEVEQVAEEAKRTLAS